MPWKHEMERTETPARTPLLTTVKRKKKAESVPETVKRIDIRLEGIEPRHPERRRWKSLGMALWRPQEPITQKDSRRTRSIFRRTTATSVSRKANGSIFSTFGNDTSGDPPSKSNCRQAFRSTHAASMSTRGLRYSKTFLPDDFDVNSGAGSIKGRSITAKNVSVEDRRGIHRSCAMRIVDETRASTGAGSFTF